MIVYCPVCQESVRASEVDVHGRCGKCSSIANVTFDGVEYAVIGIELFDEWEPAVKAKPETMRRVARGIRSYLREQGNAAVEPRAQALSTRALAEAQGFAIDHSSPAVDAHVAKLANNAGGEFTKTFEAGCRQQIPVHWESPRCEHHSKKKETK